MLFSHVKSTSVSAAGRIVTTFSATTFEPSRDFATTFTCVSAGTFCVFNKPAGVIEAYSPPETTSQLKSAFVAFNGNTVALNCSDFEPLTVEASSAVAIAISETGVYLIAASSITAMFVKYVFPVAVITTLFAPSV